MTEKHTPGPWVLKEGASYCDLFLWGPDHLIATIHSVHDGERKESPDAALLVAAPDLLAVCRLLTDGDIGPVELVRAVGAARAAIAKAEGRQA